jgi:hypothetical protein
MTAAAIARPYIARGLLLWIAARAMLSMLALVAVSAGVATHGPIFGGAVAIRASAVCLSAILGLIETAGRKERALLGNLAVSRVSFLALVAGPAMAAELTLAALKRLF